MTPARTVVPGRMVEYHNAPTPPARRVTLEDIRRAFAEGDLELEVTIRQPTSRRR